MDCVVICILPHLARRAGRAPVHVRHAIPGAGAALRGVDRRGCYCYTVRGGRKVTVSLLCQAGAWRSEAGARSDTGDPARRGEAFRGYVMVQDMRHQQAAQPPAMASGNASPFGGRSPHRGEGDAFLARLHGWGVVVLMVDDPTRDVLPRNAPPLQMGTPTGKWMACTGYLRPNVAVEAGTRRTGGWPPTVGPREWTLPWWPGLRRGGVGWYDRGYARGERRGFAGTRLAGAGLGPSPSGAARG
jgi:hypothetical protein